MPDINYTDAISYSHGVNYCWAVEKNTELAARHELHILAKKRGASRFFSSSPNPLHLKIGGRVVTL
jgi:hypothetical protein